MKRFLIGLLILILIAFLVLNMNTSTNKTDTLKAQLNEIEKLIEKRDVKNEAVSKADIAWHLDHMLKTMNGISKAMENSDPANYESSFNMMKLMSLGIGYIPRGTAQAPESVRPPDNILTQDIISQLADARQNIEMANALNKNAYFNHFVFGNLNRPTSLRLLEVHNKHHLKIVRDILGE